MRLRRLVLIGCLIVVGTGCAGGSSVSAPRPLSRYLESLRRGELPTAYALTQLGELARSGAGASLSLAHFVAFYRDHPLRRYAIHRVTRLEIRTSARAPGRPYFEADVSLVTASGTREVTFSVTAAGVVQVEPIRVFYRVPAGALTLDGVSLIPARAPGEVANTMLVLDGVHALRSVGGRVVFETSPLRVVSGPATLAGRAQILTIQS